MPRTIKLLVDIVITETEYKRQPELTVATEYAESFVDNALGVMKTTDMTLPPTWDT